MLALRRMQAPAGVHPERGTRFSAGLRRAGESAYERESTRAPEVGRIAIGLELIREQNQLGGLHGQCLAFSRRNVP